MSMTSREMCKMILDKLETLESDILCLASTAGSTSTDSSDAGTSDALRVFQICTTALADHAHEIRDDVYRSFYL